MSKQKIKSHFFFKYSKILVRYIKSQKYFRLIDKKLYWNVQKTKFKQIDSIIVSNAFTTNQYLYFEFL